MQTNISLANCLDCLEAAGTANPPEPVDNRDPLALKTYPSVAPAAPQTPPGIGKILGKAGYILQDNQGPLGYCATYAPPLKAKVPAPVVQNDRLVYGIKPLFTAFDAFHETAIIV